MMVWLVSAALARKPAPEPAPELELWSEPWIAAAVARVVPAVERHSGRTFRSPPVVELATPEEFGRVIAEEAALIMGSVQRDTPRELREQQIGGGGLVPGILGKYAVFDDKLFLCREAIERSAEKLGLPTTDLGPLATTVLAHELVHALHDQQADLAEQMRGLPDMDAMYANQGTAEGLATWVAERAAADLGLTAQASALARLQGWGEKGSEEKLLWPTWAAYGLGRDAMQWHFEHGGYDEVWAVATHPPGSSAGVFRPETWADPRRPPSRDWSAVLLGTEKKLTDADWILGISVLGEHTLRGEALYGDNEAALADSLTHLREAWQLDGALPDRAGQIRVLEFDEAAAAGRYLEQLRAQSKAEASELTRVTTREVDITFEPFTEVPADAAVLRSSRLRGTDGVWSERHAAWVQRGATIVVVTAVRFRPGLRLGWTVEEVYRRLGAIPR